MEYITNWNYSILDADGELEPLLTSDEFDEMTAAKYENDPRVDSMIKSATTAVREYCGWHVSGRHVCRWVGHSAETGRLIKLPAKFVTSIESVKVGACVLTEDAYFFKTNGLLYLVTPPHDRGYMDIEVEYVAGFEGESAAGIKELIMHRVTHALAQSFGVQSETAGGVTVSYNANWINNARATALVDDNKDMLQPYRITEVY